MSNILWTRKVSNLTLLKEYTPNFKTNNQIFVSCILRKVLVVRNLTTSSFTESLFSGDFSYFTNLNDLIYLKQIFFNSILHFF